MTVGKIKHDLLKKLIIAKIDLDGYLKMRKAKGYMSVSESEHLRENLFDFCTDFHHKFPVIKGSLTHNEIHLMQQAHEAIAEAAICLLSGRKYSSMYIAVDADKLERHITTLIDCTHNLLDKKHSASA